MEFPATSPSAWLRRVPSAMLWSDFKDRVRVLITVDGRRGGAAADDYFDENIRQFCLDAQKAVPLLRPTFRLKVPITSLQANRNAMSGWLPREAYFSAFLVRNEVEDWEVKLLKVPFERYTELVASEGLVDGDGVTIRDEDRPGFYALDPEGDRFHFAPVLTEEESLYVIYDACKSDYADGDYTPFGEDSIRAAADYVKSEYELEVNDDAQRYLLYRGRYQDKLRSLYLSEREKRIAKPAGLPEWDYDVTGYESYHDADGNSYDYAGPGKSSF